MLAAGVKFDDEQEDQDGSQGVARAGPGWGLRPLAGLPPHGPPSLTQSAAEVAPTGATATRAGSSACIFVSGRYPFRCKWTRSSIISQHPELFIGLPSVSFQSGLFILF